MPEVLINIDVDDLDEGIAFYTRAFDLRTGRRLGPQVVEMLGAEAAIYLLAKDPDTSPYTGALDHRRYGRHWTPVHLDFVVDDLEAALARAEAAGAVRERGIEEHPWGRIAYCSDPFGHGFCLVQFKGRGYGEIAS